MAVKLAARQKSPPLPPEETPRRAVTHLPSLPSADLSKLPKGWEAIVQLRVAQTDEALRDVGMLRRRAYVSVAKIEESPLPFLEAVDRAPHTRVLKLTFENRVIAAARMVFPRHRHDLCDHGEHSTWAQCFPAPYLCAETSRVVVAPELRKSGAMALMLQVCYLEALRQSRYFMLGTATEGLFPHYVRLGCQEVPIAYDHKLLGGTYHKTFVGDLIGGLARERPVHPLVWWKFHAPIIRAAQMLELNLMRSRALTPFAKHIARAADDTLSRLALMNSETR